ncbi:MAG: amino acid ABC transporter substrate-binding protein [Enhydrobacter sp.]|nr:MAG: amino acid ABC transporter substrate-binding protein [Enhydrobacter sp.]
MFRMGTTATHRSIGAIAMACIAWSMGGTAAAQETIRFGAALSLSGRLATEGKLVREGYDFFVKHINDRGGIPVGGKTYKVSIVYYDDESNTNTSVKLYEKLISEDGVKFLLGPYGSSATIAVSTVVEQHKLPMVVAHGAATTIYNRGYKYTFGVLNSVDHYTRNIVKLSSEQTPPLKRVALINENQLFPQLGIDGAAQQAKEFGLEVVFKEKYASGTKDLSSELEKMKATRPDLVIAGGYTDDMILLARQIKQVGLKPRLVGFLLGPTLPGFIRALGSDAENMLEPVQWTPGMPWKDSLFGWTAREYADLFQKQYGHAPDYHPPQSTAALEVYYHAFQKAGSLDPQKVRDAVAATDIMTAYGPIRFNANGQNVAKSMSVVQIQNGKPVVVYPLDAAEAKLRLAP